MVETEEGVIFLRQSIQNSCGSNQDILDLIMCNEMGSISNLTQKCSLEKSNHVIKLHVQLETNV